MCKNDNDREVPIRINDPRPVECVLMKKCPLESMTLDQ